MHVQVAHLDLLHVQLGCPLRALRLVRRLDLRRLFTRERSVGLEAALHGADVQVGRRSLGEGAGQGVRGCAPERAVSDGGWGLPGARVGGAAAPGSCVCRQTRG